MQVYHYEAVLVDGRRARGEIAAENPVDADAQLTGRGLTVLELAERTERRLRFGGGKSKAEEVVEFTRGASNLLAVGIPILQVLDEAVEGAERGGWRETLADVRVRIESGSSVSEALDAHRNAFGELYISMVRAGEESGSLDAVLESLADYLEWAKTMRDEVRRAFAYPGVVLTALVGFIGLLTFFVFPRLMGLFETMDVALPLPTRIMLAIGSFGVVGWPYALVALVAGPIAFAQLRRCAWAREAFDQVSLRLPIIGRVVEMAALARFVRTMGVLVGSGIVLDRALLLARAAVGNTVIAEGVEEVRERIHSGETFADSLERSGVFPRLVIRLVRTGENAGDLPGMFERLATYYEREMPYLVRRLVSAIGPLAVFILAGTVLLAALAIFLPLLSITSAVSS